MEMLKKHITIASLSFTGFMFIYTLIATYMMNGLGWGLDAETVLQFLLSHFMISGLMFLTDRLEVKDGLLSAVIDVTDICFVIFVLGGIVFKWFPFESLEIVLTFLIILVIYIFVYLMLFRRNQIDAGKINKIISETRKNDE